MAKKNPEVTVTEDSPYVSEAPKAKNSVKSILSNRSARIGAIVAGSTLALGAAFGIGLTAGHAQGPAFGDHQMGQGQFGPDRDGDHGGKFAPGQQGPNGQMAPNGQFGHHDGDHGGQFNPGQPAPAAPNAPAPSSSSTTN